MSTARHLIALLRTHVQGDEHEFLSVAMEMAAREARLGHARVAEQIRELVDQARSRGSKIEKRPGSVVVLQPKGEIANLILQGTDRITTEELLVALNERKHTAC